MCIEDFNKAMHYLDMIEVELDKIAVAFGHPTMKEFFC
jgi:hypothetical protein